MKHKLITEIAKILRKPCSSKFIAIKKRIYKKIMMILRSTHGTYKMFPENAMTLTRIAHIKRKYSRKLLENAA